jgi:hypothetical protein
MEATLGIFRVDDIFSFRNFVVTGTFLCAGGYAAESDFVGFQDFAVAHQFHGAGGFFNDDAVSDDGLR